TRLCRLKASNPQLWVLKFVTDPDLLLSLADRVVAMGGYNTVCEVLAFEKPALIVPRITPRREQFIRAQRLQQLGLVDMLHPDELNPARLFEWLAQDRAPPSRTHERVDLQGAGRIPSLLEELLPRSSCPVPEPCPVARIQYAAS
ncbi:MAG TPA: glycosyltransferase, partial [Gemmataceae bacterium]|nr:glycosyltransferase [Gemmataceae bacterium]